MKDRRNFHHPFGCEKSLKIQQKINENQLTYNEFSYKIEDFFGFKNNQIKESREEFISL